MELSFLVSKAFDITSFIFLLCCGAACVRLIIGPRGADRLVALSLISALVLGVLVVYGVQEDRGIYLDVALIYAVFGFLGILAIASFIREKKED